MPPDFNPSFQIPNWGWWIVLCFGESLGAAVALALKHPPAALVLRSPFTSLTDMGHLCYPLLRLRGADKPQPLEQVRAIARSLARRPIA